MNDDLLQTQYDVTKKSKYRIFYEKNKILIITTALIILISIGSTFLYLNLKEKKKMLLSENYITAIYHIKNKNKNQAKEVLEEIVYAEDKTYSVLSLFLIINENLINDKEKISSLFHHILENNNFDKEIENLIVLKKAIFESDYVDESELLELTKPIINSDSLWKPHALLLLGNYYFFKDEHVKSRQMYNTILTIKNLQQDIYNQTVSQLSLIANE